jgi:hypothetical protein
MNGINDIYTKFGKILSADLFTQIKSMQEYINACVPIGAIFPIMVNISGVDAPDPNIWQECDGSEITNENSPLRSTPSQPRFVPDLRDKYIRLTTQLGQVGTSGGVNQINLKHKHDVATWWSAEGADPSQGSDPKPNTMFGHSHGMSYDLVNDINIEPNYYVVKFFMRIQ